jgi:uncharacterized protein
VIQLALAALSARSLVQAALRAGHSAVALDVFGDSDTQAAAQAWHGIGDSHSATINPEMLLRALHTLSSDGHTRAWLYGSGLDGQADVVEAAEELLPLCGTRGRDLRRVRDPVRFFALLDQHHIAHPKVLFSHCPQDWLSKSAGGCGGWHISRAPQSQALVAGCYAQQEVAGRSLSATYLANGREVLVLGINEQLLQTDTAPARPATPPHTTAQAIAPTQPLAFSGVIGPVDFPAHALRDIQAALQALTLEFTLRGLGSLDFIWNGHSVQVLEVNPRPSASLPLYDRGPTPLLRSHMLACADGAGALVAPTTNVSGPQRVHGHCIVQARQPLHINQQHSTTLLALRHVHDVPRVGTQLAPGQPLCSVSATAADAHTVRTQLAQRAAGVLHTLETLQ